MRRVRHAAVVLGVVLASCAAGSHTPDDLSPDELSRLKEEAAGRAAHARGAWEAEREAEELVLTRYRAGRSTAVEASRATESRLRAERDLAVRDLAVDEIEVGSRPANRDIYAPLVESEDFVLRWLEIEEIYAARIRDNLSEQHARIDAALKNGLVGFDEVLPLDGAAAIARAEHERWRKLANLRRAITAETMDATQAYERAAEIVYSADVEIARIRVRTTNRLLKHASGQHAAGAVEESKVLALRSELLRLQNAQHEAEMGRGPGIPQR